MRFVLLLITVLAWGCSKSEGNAKDTKHEVAFTCTVSVQTNYIQEDSLLNSLCFAQSPVNCLALILNSDFMFEKVLKNDWLWGISINECQENLRFKSDYQQNTLNISYLGEDKKQAKLIVEGLLNEAEQYCIEQVNNALNAEIDSLNQQLIGLLKKVDAADVNAKLNKSDLTKSELKIENDKYLNTIRRKVELTIYKLGFIAPFNGCL